MGSIITYPEVNLLISLLIQLSLGCLCAQQRLPHELDTVTSSFIDMSLCFICDESISAVPREVLSLTEKR